jgi:phosphoserine phosphatase
MVSLYPAGEYGGFDESQPTSRTGGKPTVVAEIKKKHKTVVMIGDGATDMEASPPAVSDSFLLFTSPFLPNTGPFHWVRR